MTAPLRIAVLGNNFAARAQLPALRWAGGNEVVALAGRDPDKARRTASEWGIPVGTGDWREALEHAPDLVLVATPVHLHREMARAALEAGAAVLCEKPFALDAKEAQELAVLGQDRPAFLDHQLRFGPEFRRAQEVLRSGTLGELWHARFEIRLPPLNFLARPYGWWFDAARGGGILGALGSHMLDLLRWLLGEIDSVGAELETFVPERPDPETEIPQLVTADELASLRLRFAGGATGELRTSCTLPGPYVFELEVAGSDGALRIVGGDALSVSQAGEAFEPEELAQPLPPAAFFEMEDHGVFGRCLPLYLRALIDALRAGESSLPEAATFADGLAIQRVLDAARSSAANDGGHVACR